MIGRAHNALLGFGTIVSHNVSVSIVDKIKPPNHEDSLTLYEDWSKLLSLETHKPIHKPLPSYKSCEYIPHYKRK